MKKRISRFINWFFEKVMAVISKEYAARLDDQLEQIEMGDADFVNFGEFVCHPLLRQQSQYASRYVDGFRGEYPNLGEGLRFMGSPRDYHELLIHKNDIKEFVRRVKKHWKKIGVI